MAVIAVAGGTGNVGRTIVEGILATRKHDVVILSRKPNPSIEAELSLSVIVVDYSDVEAVTKSLEDHHVDTVISALSTSALDGSAPKEIELIRAANASKTTRRMISSDWGVPLMGQWSSAIHKRNAQDELKKATNLESTIFHSGLFSDYWGMPNVKSQLAPMYLVVDTINNAAAIPGSGNTPVAFTHSTDLAKFVAASLDLPKWNAVTYIKSDQITWNEFVHLAEQTKGTEFNVAYDAVERLNNGLVTELPIQIPMYQFVPKETFQAFAAMFGILFEMGAFNLQQRPS
ncbi:hypothetical protein GGI35DRAFT_486568 [Trichoderma velutinum]